MGGGYYYQQPGMAQPSPYGAQPQPQTQSFGPQSTATAAETRAERDARFESERAERLEKQRRELEDAQEKQRRLAEDAQHKAELQAIAQGKAAAPKPEEKPKPVVASKPKKEKQKESELRRWCDEFIKQHPILSKVFQLCALAMLAAGTQEILRTTGAWKGLGDTNSQGGSMRDDLESALGKDIGGGISDGFEKAGDFMTDIDPELAPLVVLALIVALCALNSATNYLLTMAEAAEAGQDPKPKEEVEMTEIPRPS